MSAGVATRTPQRPQARSRTLPDLLRPGLRLVFVGINPGEESARQGHYYAHAGNGFWPALGASGLVDGLVSKLERPVGPHDDRTLPAACRIGFTDVVKRIVTDSSTVTDDELRVARGSLERRIALAGPQAICFTTTRAFEVLFPRVRGRSGPAWGRQPVRVAGAEVWLMPSTSGRAIAYREHVYRVLVELATSLGAASTAQDGTA